MTRLDTELQRLYRPHASQAGTRAFVLELTGGPGWDALAPAWQGVQQDLQLPAPAIAVNGRDALQLWFSCEQALPTSQAQDFLQALCRRYLPGVRPESIRLHGEPPALPPFEAAAGQWSSFLAPDLAALFAEEPWLDLPPGAEAQAELLSRLDSARAADLERARALVQQPAPAAAEPPAPGAHPGPVGLAPQQDPRRFLLAVMNDAAIDLRLRIEAAKALLGAPEPR